MPNIFVKTIWQSPLTSLLDLGQLLIKARSAATSTNMGFFFCFFFFNSLPHFHSFVSLYSRSLLHCFAPSHPFLCFPIGRTWPHLPLTVSLSKSPVILSQVTPQPSSCFTYQPSDIWDHSLPVMLSPSAPWCHTVSIFHCLFGCFSGSSSIS